MKNKLELSTRLWFVLTPLACITVFGLVGNVMTLITVLNKHCKKTSFTVFLAALALTDTVVLAFTPPHAILRYILQGTNAVIMCKFFAFLGYGSRHVYAWLVVGLTLERTFAVYFPTKVKDYCVPKTGPIVVAIVIVMAAAVDVHFLFGYTFTEVGNTTDCGFVSEGFEHFYHFIYPWIDLVITLILPAIVIIASNTAILVRVFNVTSVVASTTAESNRREKNKQLVKIVFLVSASFLVLNTPLPVYSAIRPYIYELSNGAYEFANETDANLFAVFTSLFLLNHGINFLLYVLSGKRFRNELRNGLCSPTPYAWLEPGMDSSGTPCSRTDHVTDSVSMIGRTKYNQC